MLNPNNWKNKIADQPLYSKGAGTDPEFMAPHHIVTEITANGALGLTGYMVVTKAGVCAMTLAAPIAGAVSAGGNDGQEVIVKSRGAYAHTLTTPSNKLNGNKAIATFGGAVTDYIVLRAFNGVWDVVGSSGITLS